MPDTTPTTPATPRPPQDRLPRPPRTPNFVRIIATGAILGALVGGLIAWTGVLTDESAIPQGYKYGMSDGVGILAMFGGVLGAIVAAVVAVLLDRTGRD